MRLIQTQADFQNADKTGRIIRNLRWRNLSSKPGRLMATIAIRQMA
jgi:hypothetical protein